MTRQDMVLDKGRTCEGTVVTTSRHYETASWLDSMIYGTASGRGETISPERSGLSCWIEAQTSTTSSDDWSLSYDAFSLQEIIATNKVGVATVTDFYCGLCAKRGLGIQVWTSDFMTTCRRPPAVDADDFTKEERAFLRMKDELLKHETYRDKFVAILDEKLIDSDYDRTQLAKRCYKKYGYKPIYFDKVERVKRIVHIPSPKRVQ